MTETNGSGTFCVNYCGYHTHASINGADIKYAFVGDAANQCITQSGPTCATENKTVSPNGNPGVDAMASTITHELNESATDPDLNAWFHLNTAGEVGDLCNFDFGPQFTVANGSEADFSVGGRNYLIQQNWLNANGGSCAMSFTPPATGQPTVQLIDQTEGGTNYKVGDSFTVSIHGAPNQQVTVTQTTNGVPGSPFVFGQTDSSGNFSVSGTWAPSNAGSYTQLWAVGGVAAGPTLRFFVRPTVQLIDLTRGGTDFQAGDTFNLIVAGPPNQTVTVIQSENGAPGSPFQFGQTDSNGNFSITGTWSSSNVGSYGQIWSVGNLQATPTLAIIVNP